MMCWIKTVDHLVLLKDVMIKVWAVQRLYCEDNLLYEMIPVTINNSSKLKTQTQKEKYLGLLVPRQKISAIS